MAQRISVITPTCDRPVGIRLLERFMARQTRQPDEWIVGDGGQTKAPCTSGQRHIWAPQPAGNLNFTTNLLTAVQAATGDIIVIAEDDDWMSPLHIETLVGQLQAPGILAAGDDLQQYYHVGKRVWRTFNNRGASLCQTAISRELVYTFVEIIERCGAGTYGVDGTFWKTIPDEFKSLVRSQTVIGIKGLPGRQGLGIGHRPGGGWTSDPGMDKLRSWVGDDCDLYRHMGINGTQVSPPLSEIVKAVRRC